MVGYLPHCTFRLNPRAASIDTPLHAYVPRAHVDHMHADAIIAIAASANSQELTERDLRRRDRLAAVEAPRLRARPLAGEILPREPGRQGRRAGEPRPLHLGRRRARPATRPRSGSSTGPSTGSTRETAGKPAFGGPRHAAAARRRSAARIAAALMPAIRGMVSKAARAWSATSTTRTRCWSSSAPATCAPLAALGTSCPDHFLRTKIRPLVVDFDPASARRRRDARRPAGRGRGLPRGLRRLLRPLQAPRQPGDARPERGGLPRPRRRHDHLRPRQGDRAHLGRVLRQRHQRHARRQRGLRVPRPAGAGGLRHRVLAARGGQAPAHAEAQEPRRPHRARHRRRRRHRLGHRRAPARRGRLRRARRHRRRGAGRDTAASLAAATPPTWCAPSR